MTPTQRKALQEKATQFRRACQYPEAKGVDAAIRVLEQLGKTKTRRVPANIKPVAMKKQLLDRKAVM